MLDLRTRRGGTTPAVHGGVIEVRSELEYVVEGPPDSIDRVTEALPGIAERITETATLLAFGNTVGVLDVPELGRLNIVTGKWAPDDSTRMLDDLTRVISGLPFRGPGAPRLRVERRIGDPAPIYHAFNYLRTIAIARSPQRAPLQVALTRVLSAPHSRWKTVRRHVPLDRLQHADPKTARELVHADLQSTAERSLPPGPRALAARLGGHLPVTVPEPAHRATVDVAENRFVLAFIRQVASVIRTVEQHLAPRANSALGRRVLSEAARMRDVLEPYLRHPMWKDVGPLTRIPASSAVLQQRRGYKETFRFHQRLRLAAAIPVRGDAARELLEGKNIAQLYELWCYFAMVEVVEGLRGRPMKARAPGIGPFQISIPCDFSVEWPGGIRLAYNARFSRSRPPEHRSYSTPLRPDITLELPSPEGQRLYLFDAKFRVTSFGIDRRPDEEDLDEGGAESPGTFKREDLHKMHTYRDALSGVVGVWILYPGTESRFFHIGGSTGEVARRWDGVGALPLRPNAEHHGALPGLLRELTAQVIDIPPSLPTAHPHPHDQDPPDGNLKASTSTRVTTK